MSIIEGVFAHKTVSQDPTVDDLREDIRTILFLLPADTLHLLEEKKLSFMSEALISIEVSRRTEA